VFYLAQSYFNLGDYANAREWSVRRAADGRLGRGGVLRDVPGSPSRCRGSVRPWPDVQDAFLAGLGIPTNPRRNPCTPPKPLPPGTAPICATTSVTYFCPARRLNPVAERGHYCSSTRTSTNGAQVDEQAVCASWIGKTDGVVHAAAGNYWPDGDLARRRSGDGSPATVTVRVPADDRFGVGRIQKCWRTA